MLSRLTVKPIWYEFEITRGRTARFRITLYEDKAKTNPINIEGATVKVKIGNYLELTVGTGLTVKLAQGVIEGELTKQQTNGFPNARESFVIDLEEGSEEVTPITGVFIVKTLQEN